MKETVGIAELKARLSHHLRVVRSTGRPITVLDRDRPVATLGPFRPQRGPRVTKPEPGAPGIHDIPLPPPLEVDPEIDIVDLLLEERQGDR